MRVMVDRYHRRISSLPKPLWALVPKPLHGASYGEVAADSPAFRRPAWGRATGGVLDEVNRYRVLARRQAAGLGKLGMRPKMRPLSGHALSERSQLSGFALVSDAEDAGFEPARACTQHAFQQCWPAFTTVRHRP